MPSQQDYIIAIRRKVAIATFHLKCLEKLLKTTPSPDESGLPPIAVQAHFESLITALDAAKDKALKIKSLKAITSFSKWKEQSFAEDIREVRRGIVHHTYDKKNQIGKWEVEKPSDSSWEGDRELLAYCKAAVAHGEALLGIITTSVSGFPLSRE